jgi:hypothetical protein
MGNNKDISSFVHTIRVKDILSTRDCELFLIDEADRIAKLNKPKVYINGYKAEILIDSGSPIPIIQEGTFNSLGKAAELRETNLRIFGYGSTNPIKMLGEAILTFSTEEGKEVRALAYVASGNYGNILDTKTAGLLGLLVEDWHVTRDPDKNNLNTIGINLRNSYPNVFSGRIGCLKQFEATIHVNANIPPVTNQYRPVPYHQREPVEQELNRMIEAHIIEPVPDEPTSWVLPMVIVKKDDGSIRLCTDGRALKPAIMRTKHPPVTVSDIRHKLAGSTAFSKIDLKKGYYQLKLAKKSRTFTTFATHMGLFRYKRLNMGISCSGEIFQHEISRILRGIPNQINISDDILIFTKPEEDHNAVVKQVFKKLDEHGLTVNEEKCQINTKELKFFGMVFSKDGIAPDPEKVAAIRNARHPQSAEELRSFLGLANYVTSHIIGFAEKTASLWALTHKGRNFKWEDSHTEAFNELKETICTKANAYYNPDWKTIVVTDASGLGLGAVLIQEDPENNKERRIVECCSRLLSKTEKKYSTIEKEALGVVWACEKLQIYLDMAEFIIVTDNRAVELIYRNPASKPPIRLQRWALRLNSFNFRIIHQAGKTNIADFLSRTSTISTDDDTDLENQINMIIGANLPTSMNREEIAFETSHDEQLQEIIQEITSKHLKRDTDTPDPIKEYRGRFASFSVTSDGLLITDNKIVIPAACQQKLLTIAHDSHQGSTKTYQMLKEKVWFKGMKGRVEEMVKACETCQIVKEHITKHPINMNKLPEEPWDQVSTDFYGPLSEDGRHIMVVTDQYSRYPFAVIINSVAAKHVIPELENIFRTFGYPRLIRSDNGAPYSGHEWADYTKSHDIQRDLITPYHAQANGLVESFMKNLTLCRRVAHVNKTNYRATIDRFIADYRSTPHSSTGKTPVSLMFTYNCNTTSLPFIRSIRKADSRFNVEKRIKKQKQT